MSSPAVYILILIASSMLFATSWLREPWSIAIWIGFILFLTTVRRDSIRNSILSTMLFGVVGMGISFYWATKTLAFTLNTDEGSIVPWIVFAMLLLWESIPFACLGWMIFVQRERFGVMWMAPMVWVVFESVWPRVFPWSLSHSQTKFLPFIQAAEIGGTSLVSFIFLYACFGISSLLQKPQQPFVRIESYGSILLALVSIFVGWGRLTWLESTSPAKSMSIGVVQIDPSFNDSLQRMRNTSESMREKIDLYVWPESTIGTYSTDLQSLDQAVKDVSVAKPPFVEKEFAMGMASPLLVGGRTFKPGTDEAGPFWQTAFLLDSEGKILETYNKRHLIPIGEFVPFEKHFPVFHEWAQLSEYMHCGTSDAPIIVPGGPSIGVLICYEDLIQSAARRTVIQGAEILVGIINASAFEIPEALEQHRRLSLLRSVENRRSFVRCAGTGVSCYISHTGRELVRMNPMEQGKFVVQVPLFQHSTIYGNVGYLAPWLMFVMVVGRFLVPGSTPFKRDNNQQVVASTPPR